MSRFPSRATKDQVLRAHAYLCAYCLTGHATTVDHIRPKCRGGRDGISNLAATCETCNGDKGGLSVVEWVERRAEARARELVAAGWPRGWRRLLPAALLPRTAA